MVSFEDTDIYTPMVSWKVEESINEQRYPKVFSARASSLLLSTPY